MAKKYQINRPDKEIQKKLGDMAKFIELEGHEKAEEIDIKAEEEFNVIKGQTIQNSRVEIMKEFQKKETNFLNHEKLIISRLKHKQKFQEAENKARHLEEIQEIVRNRIESDIMSRSIYNDILTLLILEGLYMLLEEKVKIQCRRKDINLARSLLPSIELTYKQKTNRNIFLSIDKNVLPDSILGGAVLTTKNGKIIIENTLDLRLERIMYQCRAPINENLFKK